MKKEYRLLGWLIANLVLLNIGMLMTWFILGFEPPPALKPISGWDFIFTRIATQSDYCWSMVLLGYGYYLFSKESAVYLSWAMLHSR